MDRDPGSNWIAIQLRKNSARVQTVGFPPRSRGPTILVVVNSVMDTQLHVADTSATDTCELPSECSQADIDDMEEASEHDIEAS